MIDKFFKWHDRWFLRVLGTCLLIFFGSLLCSSCLGDIHSLTRDVTYLADDARRGRAPGSPGMVQSQKYVIASLRAVGFIPVTQPVGNCRNVIGVVEGSQPESYVVVGAHLDHLGVVRGRIQNGADDNASGSAVLLELARRAVTVSPRRTIHFVWFTAEERGLVGSKAYVDAMPRLPVLMINMDMVGRLRDNLNRHRATSGRIGYLFEKYPFASRITYRSPLSSDCRSFAGCGVPTLSLHTGLHNIYHTSRDDTETLDFRGLDQISNYACDLLHHVAGFDKK